ncbi:hypothetical protein [Kangiella sp. M94]
MIKLLTIIISIWGLASCSIFSAPKTLVIGENSEPIEVFSCISFKQDKVTVFYKRYKRGGEVYKGDIAFSFRPDNLIKVDSRAVCTSYKKVLLEDVLNYTVGDTGSFKVVISLKLITDTGTFEGRGESVFYNSFSDISGDRTQQARKEALEAAIKLAVSELESH